MKNKSTGHDFVRRAKTGERSVADDYMARMASGKMHEKKIATVHSVPTWDADTFYAVCADHGYRSEYTVNFVLQDWLDLSKGAVTTLLKTGRFTWGQVLVIGAQLEMTPREFCDVFCHDYFRETASGVYRAYIDDIRDILGSAPKRETNPVPLKKKRQRL